MTVGHALLFVPADRPDRLPKALCAGADSVAVDLEDAVAEQAKESAREQAIQAITGAPAGTPLYLRINGMDTGWADGDLAAVGEILPSGRLTGVLVPKVESAEQLRLLHGALSELERAAGCREGTLAVAPILETAAGILAAPAIAHASQRMSTVVFGTLDLSTHLGVTPTVAGTELLHARSQVVLACAAAGLAGPVDGPHPNLDDAEGLRTSSLATKALGFTGRVVLHPKQVDVVREVFAPSAAELARARAVLAAYRQAESDGLGAIRLPDGTFVDRPVVARAAALLGEGML